MIMIIGSVSSYPDSDPIADNNYRWRLVAILVVII